MYAYLCGTELGSSSLKLSDRCKHVHAVVHVDLLYTVKHGTEDTTERGTVPENEKKNVWYFLSFSNPQIIMCFDEYIFK